jgi:hypothetical protein
VTDDAPQCQDILLTLTALSDTNPRFMLDGRAGNRIVAATPGVHLYRRWFRFPSSSAGQSFDVVLGVSNPAGTQVVSQIRVNHLIAVTTR